MNIEMALQIFTLGVKFGAHQSKLGLDITAMTDERLADILLDGFQQHLPAIEVYSKQLQIEQAKGQWYAEHWTAKQSFHFGLLAGFDEWQKTPADKQGVKILTNEVIDKLTQLQFRSCKNFGED